MQSGNPPPDMMIFHDPPRHEHLRRLIGRTFTPRRVAELEGQIRAMSVEWLDPLVDAGGGEIVADLAGKLPGAVIATLLGVPVSDHGRIKSLSDRMLHREGRVIVDARRRHAGCPRADGDLYRARCATPCHSDGRPDLRARQYRGGGTGWEGRAPDR